MPETHDSALDPTSTGLTAGVAEVAAQLTLIREEWRKRYGWAKEYGSEGFPSQGDLSKIMMALSGAFYPLRLGPDFGPPGSQAFLAFAPFREVRLTVSGG